MADSAVEIGLRASPMPLGTPLNNNAILSSMMWPLLRETHGLDSDYLTLTSWEFSEYTPNFLLRLI